MNASVIPGFKAVEFMRKQRSRIDEEIKGMTFKELQNYFGSAEQLSLKERNSDLMQKRIKIYLDTSVIGGMYDVEFEHDTKLLFDKILKGEYEAVYSEVTEKELSEAPEHIRSVLDIIPDGDKTRLKQSPEANLLAFSYIYNHVVGETSFEDCLHIALAAIHKVDILVSWNFKHIVNVKRIKGYNFVNNMHGYATVDIRSPKELA